MMLAVVATTFASAGWNDSSTGIDLNALPHFPLVKLRSGLFLHGTQTTFDQIHATFSSSPDNEEGVVLRGSGVYGKRWEVHLSALDEVWRGDLDGNGIPDYVFFSVGPYGNGRTAAPFSMSILLMDGDQMPMPFFTTVYHGENGDGIKHLIDFTHDGHAELLLSDYDEHVSDPQADTFGSGHWTHQLVRFNNLAAEHLRGVFDGIRFPLIHAWSDGPSSSPEHVKLALEAPFIYDHSTSVQHKVVTSLRAGRELSIVPVNGCDAVTAGPIFFDNAGVREIAFPSPFGEYRARIAERIRRAGLPVELRGLQKTPAGCRANLVWAHKQ